jgi:catechol 2,3-dioxygenase-like lactoylglutathione lyase family enzyme
MRRTWTIIGVRDVPGSFKWYQSLFGLPETPPGHDDFGQILDTDGTVLLCLHQWGAHEHPSLLSPDAASPGNGLLLFFRVDDFDLTLKRARTLVRRFEQEPRVNPNTHTREFSLRDLDGYYVTISELNALQRRGARGGRLTSACSRRRRSAKSGSHGRDVRAFAAEALTGRPTRSHTPNHLP